MNGTWPVGHNTDFSEGPTTPTRSSSSSPSPSSSVAQATSSIYSTTYQPCIPTYLHLLLFQTENEFFIQEQWRQRWWRRWWRQGLHGVFVRQQQPGIGRSFISYPNLFDHIMIWEQTTESESQGNHYCHRDYSSGGSEPSNSNSYHYSNTDGIYIFLSLSFSQKRPK